MYNGFEKKWCINRETLVWLKTYFVQMLTRWIICMLCIIPSEFDWWYNVKWFWKKMMYKSRNIGGISTQKFIEIGMLFVGLINVHFEVTKCKEDERMKLFQCCVLSHN